MVLGRDYKRKILLWMFFGAGCLVVACSSGGSLPELLLCNCKGQCKPGEKCMLKVQNRLLPMKYVSSALIEDLVWEWHIGLSSPLNPSTNSSPLN